MRSKIVVLWNEFRHTEAKLTPTVRDEIEFCTHAPVRLPFWELSGYKCPYLAVLEEKRNFRLSIKPTMR